MATNDEEWQGPPATAVMQPPNAAPSARIGVIAEDDGVADSLLMLLTSHAYDAERLPMNPDLAGDWDGQSFYCLVVAQYGAGLPGLSLLSTRRTRGSNRPAALITNAMSPQNCARAVRLGGVTLLEKPVSPSAVLAYVRRYAVRAAAAQPGEVMPAAVNGGDV